ncbi:glutamyl-tRNA amidotransferase [Platysternon megacephalum]|uniref:Succinate-semialdehyde dehydrogenase, mitochondrial n=1 Tax=Platysternon megacephalum TaxID=55544 RepID=A0A4D9DDU9_9SAUR|nr:glutamyl-tRNA amidotransferase [Platysternon megacephalum]
MELGGNAPFIVFPDADLDAAVAGAMLAKMRNIGEACTAANRFYVHTDVAQAFTEKFAEKMRALTVAPGLDENSQVGSLITPKARDGVQALVDDAVAKGATVVCGGTPVGERGSFYAPTVLSGVTDSAKLTKEEIFDEVIRRANDTEYGLVAYVFTRDLSRAVRLAEALDYGMVGINQGVVSNPAAPFGGVKQSGIGREGGAEGIEEYLETKYVGIAL